MIQRKDCDIIVPVGDTRLLADDKVVMIEAGHDLKFPKNENNKGNTD